MKVNKTKLTKVCLGILLIICVVLFGYYNKVQNDKQKEQERIVQEQIKKQEEKDKRIRAEIEEKEEALKEDMEIIKKYRSKSSIRDYINDFMDYYLNNENDLTDEQKNQILADIIVLKSEFKKFDTLNKFYMSDYNSWKIKYIEPQIGMSKIEVYALTKYSCPEDINKTTTTYSISEQYCYEGYRYLYFEDGILTSIQE